MWQREIIDDVRVKEFFRDVRLFGVAGTNGSGKDTVMELLAEQGFLRYSTSDGLRQIAQAVFNSTDRGGNDAPMGQVGNAFRTAYPGGVVDVGLLDYWFRVGVLPVELRPKGLVIGSIRGTGEAERLQDFGGQLIAVDADPKIRYQRLFGRHRADDSISYEDFLAKEAGDLAEGQTDPTKFGMAAVIARADITLTNDAARIDEFKAQASKALEL
jgi:dephospho-CoA kinase